MDKSKTNRLRKVFKSVGYYNDVKYKDKNGIVHNEEGPAWISESVSSYFIDGEYHREDGPARIWIDGVIEFVVKGKYIY